MGKVALLAQFPHASLERGLGSIEDTAFDASIEILKGLLGFGCLALQFLDPLVNGALTRNPASM